MMRGKDLSFNESEGTFAHRVAAIIIKDNKMLLAKSSEHPCYYAIGGAVEINETSEEAVIREVSEELGLNIEIDRLICVQERFLTVSDKKYHEVGFYYLMKIGMDFNIACNSHTDQPMETLHWISLDDLLNVNIVPESLKSLDYNQSQIIHIISKES